MLGIFQHSSILVHLILVFSFFGFAFTYLIEEFAESYLSSPYLVDIDFFFGSCGLPFYMIAGIYCLRAISFFVVRIRLRL